jgi:hypothetical protein
MERDQVSVSKSNVEDIFQCRQNQCVDGIEDVEDDEIEVDIEEDDDDEDVDIENDDSHRKTSNSTSTKVTSGDKFSIDSLLRHKSQQTSTTSAGTTLSNVINNNKSVDMSTILVETQLQNVRLAFY